MKEIKDYLHLYLGANYKIIWLPKHKFKSKKKPGTLTPSSLYNISKAAYSPEYYKVVLFLRPLSDMTEEEKKELTDIMFVDTLRIFETNVGFRWYVNPGRFLYLLSKHFDLFGLIEAGLAIDKTQLKMPNYMQVNGASPMPMP